MKDFELSNDAAAKLEEQVEEAAADNDEDSQDGDSVEQSLDVPTKKPEDEAVELVQKQYEEKSGLELDDDSARGIVNTARAGGGSSGNGSASESDSSSHSDSEPASDKDADSEIDADSNKDGAENDSDSEKDAVKAESSGDAAD
jgi:hypothetical protein